MGSIVEAAIYEYIGKFFLIFVVVPVGIMVLGYIISIIVEVINGVVPCKCSRKIPKNLLN